MCALCVLCPASGPLLSRQQVLDLKGVKLRDACRATGVKQFNRSTQQMREDILKFYDNFRRHRDKQHMNAKPRVGDTAAAGTAPLAFAASALAAPAVGDKAGMGHNRSRSTSPMPRVGGTATAAAASTGPKRDIKSLSKRQQQRLKAKQAALEKEKNEPFDPWPKDVALTKRLKSLLKYRMNLIAVETKKLAKLRAEKDKLQAVRCPSREQV